MAKPMKNPTLVRLSESDRLVFKLALETFQLSKGRLERVGAAFAAKYGLKEGDSVDEETGVITRA